MDTQQLLSDKLHIISWISQLQDYSLIEKIKSLMTTTDDSSLSDEQKIAIDEAFYSIESKGTITHHMVMEETKKRYPNLQSK